MDPNSNQNIQPTKPHKKPKKLIIGLLILAAIVVIGGAFALNRDEQEPTQTTNTNTQQQSTEKTATLALEPPQSTTTQDEVVTLSVYIDTGTQSVNAVQANLSYPTDKYDFISIDDTGSAFSISAEAKGGDGVIKIARGQAGGVTGKQLVAKVNLKQKAGSGQGEIKFADGTEAISANEPYANILNTTSGATLTLGE